MESEPSTEVPILAYHSVADAGPDELKLYRISTDAFRQQLFFLHRSGFCSISLDQWAMSIDAKRGPAIQPVIITFDDGYEDFIDNAWPLLEREGFTATLFVVTDYVGGTADWDKDITRSRPLSLMNWEHLRYLRAHGVDIQSHTATHRDLLTLSQDEVMREAIKAQQSLFQNLGIEPHSIAFPYGRTNPQVAAAFCQSGYRIGLNTTGRKSRLGDSLMDLPRIQIDADDDISSFTNKVLTAGSERSIALVEDRSAESFTIAPVSVKSTSDLRESRGRSHAAGTRSFASKLDKLICDFVTLQMQLIEAGASERLLQTRLRALFSKPILRDTSELLQPYQEISPGVYIGFENSARVHYRVSCKQDHSVSPESFLNTIGLTFQGVSRWLTVEIPLDWGEISMTREFQFSLFAETNRRLWCKLVLRLYSKPTGFKDITLAELNISQSHRCDVAGGEMTIPDLVDIDTSQKPRLLIFFDPTSDLSIKINYIGCYFC
jgi:peptidoglycan/xylan/chitin deacetylase (PgdA/CDA1 family)